MRFLADMGVAQRVVDWLRANGHDALHLREEELGRLPDVAIFQKTYDESRILLTFDLDFGEILAMSAGVVRSVIIFRLHNTSTHHVIDRLRKVLVDSSLAIERGAIVVVEESRHRVRPLPLGA
ncbi:MAG: DUF5615 family PIN-like protein [Acidobacteriota bacterium]